MSVSTSHLVTDNTAPTDTIRLATDGTGRAEFSDSPAPIEVRETTTEDARRELLTLCVETAQRRGAPIQVTADEDGAISILRVSPGGSITSVEDEDFASNPGPSGKRRRTFAEARARRADPETFSPRPRPVRRSSSATTTNKTLATGDARRRAWVPVAAIVAAGVIVAAAVIFVLGTFFGGADHAQQSNTDQVAVQPNASLPQRPPLEWRKDALWASPALLPEAQKVAVIDGTLVGMVTSDRRVAVVGDDAQTRWTAPLPEGTVHSPLTLAMIDGSRVLAIHVGSQLVWWPVEGGEQQAVALPSEEAPVTWRGDTPLVGTGATSVAIVRGGQLAQVDVPQGARAVSGWTDGHIIAASSTGWWRLPPGQPAGPETPWQTPAKTPDQLTVIDGMGAYIVTAQPIGKKGVQAVIHQDTPEGVVRVMAGEVPGAKAGEALTWRPSSSRTWGILGTAIVDVQKASVSDIGRPFTVSHVIADRALGTLGQQQVVVSPDAPTGVLQDGESFPEEILGRNAVVRSQSANGQQQVYVLPPNPDVPTATR